MSIIIKNVLQLEGIVEDVDKVVKEIRGGKTLFDFNKVEPLDKDNDDLDMNDYMCACLNVYMEESNVNREQFIKMCTFVGTTRETPYKFTVLTPKQLNSVKSKIKKEKIIKDAKSFLDRVRSKAIFNGYMIREAAWGTGSNAMNVKVKGNRIEFDTYDLAPIRLIEKIAMKYPNIRFIYRYICDNKVNELSIKNDEIRVLIYNETDDIRTFDLITQNVSI